jgi:hypothetical protein
MGEDDNDETGVNGNDGDTNKGVRGDNSITKETSLDST